MARHVFRVRDIHLSRRGRVAIAAGDDRFLTDRVFAGLTHVRGRTTRAGLQFFLWLSRLNPFPRRKNDTLFLKFPALRCGPGCASAKGPMPRRPAKPGGLAGTRSSHYHRAHATEVWYAKDFGPYTRNPSRATMAGKRAYRITCHGLRPMRQQEAGMAKKSTDGENSALRALAGTGSLAAAIILMISAVVTVLEGISALTGDKFFVRVPDSYLYRLNPTAWGCILIVLGALVGAVAVG